jgi:D-alanyl-D-alanine carboxypeptidase
MGMLICGLCCWKASFAGTDPALFLSQIQQQYGVGAVSLSIVKADGSIQDFVTGTVSAQSQTPITANSLFYVDSLTKSFTAALALKLVGAHQLNLNAPLSQYLPQYPNWGGVTILELLNQTSGLPDYTNAPGWFDGIAAHPHKVWTAPEVIQAAYNQAFLFPSGEGWAYSNTNYVLLGMIIEKITGKSIAQNFQAEFFGPLKLQHTYYMVNNPSSKIVAQLVHGYFYDHDVTSQNPSSWQAAGAIISNPHDMALWFSDLMTGKVLTPDELAEMQTLVSTQDGSPLALAQAKIGAYGLGVFYANMGAPFWFVPGMSSGYRALVVYFPLQKTSYALSISSALAGYGDGVTNQILSNLVSLNSSSTPSAPQHPLE